jgi:hypothetical protein
VTDEETIQIAIANLRELNSQLLKVPETSRSNIQVFVLAVAPNILPILRVALKMAQLNSELTRSSSDFRRELNLAQSIISATKQKNIDYDIYVPTELDEE